jgi:hypothetical protein
VAAAGQEAEANGDVGAAQFVGWGRDPATLHWSREQVEALLARVRGSALLCGCANPGRASRAQGGILRPQARFKPLFGAKLTYCTRYVEVIVTLAPYQR